MEDIEASIVSQVEKELLLNRFINHAYVGGQADRFLDTLTEIKEAHKTDRQAAKQKEETSELASLANALSYFHPNTYKHLSLLDYLQSKTLEIGLHQIEFFKKHGRNHPPPPSEQENKKTICWRDLLKFRFVSAYDLKLRQEENYYPLKEGFQHETLFVRDMILTCVTYNFRNNDQKFNRETQVTSSCELDFPTYREKYVVHDLLSWYGLEDVDTTRFPERIWTTKQLYEHVSEVILENLYHDAALSIAKSRGMNIAENSLRNYELAMPGPSNVTRQGTPKKQGQGSSGARLEIPSTSKEEKRVSPLERMKHMSVALAGLVHGKEGMSDVTSMEVDEDNLDFPAITNVKTKDKATSTATLGSEELCETDVVMYKKNTWITGSYEESSPLSTALVNTSVVGSAVGSPSSSSTIESEAADRMVLRSDRTVRHPVRKLFSKK